MNALDVPTSFGEEAMAMDITMQLTIDLLVQANPEFGRQLSIAIGEMIEVVGPTKGTKQALGRIKAHVDQVLADH